MPILSEHSANNTMKKTDLHVVEASPSTRSRKVKIGMQRTEKRRRSFTRYYKNILVPYSIFKISFTQLSPLHTSKQVSASKTSRYGQTLLSRTVRPFSFRRCRGFNHSLGPLSYDRSRASSKASSTQCAI